MNLEERFWEVDLLRGFAIVMMVTYHMIYDLTYFGASDFNLYSGFLWYFARITAFIFIFLVGVSLKLSYSRSEELHLYTEDRDLFLKYLKRGLKIFVLGLGITMVTWIFIRGDFIIFGVLHFIGIAIIMEALLIKKGYTNLLLGIAFITAGLYLQNLTFNFSWLLWLGFIPQNLQTVDYFPLLPWLGVVSLGLFFGGILYKNYKRRFKILDLSRFYPTRCFCFLGRNSLLIYLVHQPILIIILYFLGVLKFGYLFQVLSMV